MFSVRSLPRASRSVLSASRPVSQQRFFWKELFGIVDKQTPAEAAESKKAAVPLMQGPGAPLGSVPTDYEQATGIERYQMLGNMAGIDVFDQKALEMTKMGTMQDPVLVNSVIDNRIIGCSGFPVDSHDLKWFNLTAGKIGRCKECGCCFELTYHNPWSAVIPSVAEEAKGAKLISPAHHGHDDHGDHGHGYEKKSAH